MKICYHFLAISFLFYTSTKKWNIYFYLYTKEISTFFFYFLIKKKKILTNLFYHIFVSTLQLHNTLLTEECQFMHWHVFQNRFWNIIVIKIMCYILLFLFLTFRIIVEKCPMIFLYPHKYWRLGLMNISNTFLYLTLFMLELFLQTHIHITFCIQ